ncbi:MAG: hypothetical protein K2K97_08815 [Muribaculaceae bacterium]|nr:hypothetical protein [Muribaculaceae bacterium]
MDEERFKMIETNGVVIYDESDDYVPGEDYSEDICELEGNEDLNMEYILATERERGAGMLRRKRIDGVISVSVVVCVALYIAILCWMFF